VAGKGKGKKTGRKPRAISYLILCRFRRPTKEKKKGAIKRRPTGRKGEGGRNGHRESIFTHNRHEKKRRRREGTRGRMEKKSAATEGHISSHFFFMLRITEKKKRKKNREFSRRKKGKGGKKREDLSHQQPKKKEGKIHVGEEKANCFSFIYLIYLPDGKSKNKIKKRVVALS